MTSQENPYAVSELCSGHSSAGVIRDFSDPYEFDVEIPFLLCGRVITLPQICVLSGDTTDLVMMSVVATPRWLVFGRRCEIDYFLTRQQRWKLRLTQAGGALLSLAGIYVGTSGLDDLAWRAYAIPFVLRVICGLIMFCGGIYVIRTHGQVNFSIDRHEAGKRFWVRGFRTDFLELLRLRSREPQSSPSA